jgi:hypothetical protein
MEADETNTVLQKGIFVSSSVLLFDFAATLRSSFLLLIIKVTNNFTGI